MNLGDAVRSYVKQHSKLRPKTRTNYISAAATFDKFLPGPINKLSAPALNGMAAARIKAGCSARTINLELAIARLALSAAGEWHRFAHLLKFKRPDQAAGIALTPGQEALLISVARRTPGRRHAADAIEIALNTGMRRGEIQGLRVAHVDLERNVLLIARTKTGNPRSVPLNQRASTILASRIAATDRQRDSLLFPAGFLPAWRSSRKEAALPTLRFHDLRHTAITKLAERSVPESTIREIVGHLSPQMTALYTHPHQAAMKQAVQSLSEPASPPPAAAPPSPPPASVLPILAECAICHQQSRRGFRCTDPACPSHRFAQASADPPTRPSVRQRRENAE